MLRQEIPNAVSEADDNGVLGMPRLQNLHHCGTQILIFGEHVAADVIRGDHTEQKQIAVNTYIGSILSGIFT